MKIKIKDKIIYIQKTDAISFKDLYYKKDENKCFYSKNDKKNILESYLKNNGSLIKT